MSDDHNHITQLKDLLYHWGVVLPLLIFSATAHAMLQWKRAKDFKEEFTMLDFAIAMIISGFAGMMFGLGAAYLLEDKLAILWLSGMGAFLGLRGLNRLADVALDVLMRSKKP